MPFSILRWPSRIPYFYKKINPTTSSKQKIALHKHKNAKNAPEGVFVG
jgi:hypothetical protein